MAAGMPRSLPVPDSGVIEFADQPWNSDVLCYSFSDFLTPPACIG
jgi:prolyl oligopeptidase